MGADLGLEGFLFVSYPLLGCGYSPFQVGEGVLHQPVKIPQKLLVFLERNVLLINQIHRPANFIKILNFLFWSIRKLAKIPLRRFFVW